MGPRISRLTLLAVGALAAGIGLGCQGKELPPEPPPLDREYPHEPDSMTKLTERRFGARLEDAWGIAFDSSFTLDTDINAPKSPVSIGIVTYKPGFVGGREPINIYKVFPEAIDTMYVSFWLKLSENWVGHPGSGTNKVLHMFIAGSNRVVFAANGRNAGTLNPRIILQQIASDGGFRNLDPNIVLNSELKRGTWHRIEFVLRVNTAGNANGSVDLWVDEQKVLSFADIAYVNASQAHNWVSLNWAPTWGGTGSVVTDAAISQSIDHLYVSGR